MGAAAIYHLNGCAPPSTSKFINFNTKCGNSRRISILHYLTVLIDHITDWSGEEVADLVECAKYLTPDLMNKRRRF